MYSSAQYFEKSANNYLLPPPTYDAIPAEHMTTLSSATICPFFQTQSTDPRSSDGVRNDGNIQGGSLIVFSRFGWFVFCHLF